MTYKTYFFILRRWLYPSCICPSNNTVWLRLLCAFQLKQPYYVWELAKKLLTTDILLTNKLSLLHLSISKLTAYLETNQTNQIKKNNETKNAGASFFNCGIICYISGFSLLLPKLVMSIKHW